MKQIAAALALLATASPVLALSCLPVDPAGMYQIAAEATDRYVAVHGSFLRDGPDIPAEGRESDDATPYGYDALFYGDLGSRVGFRTPVELNVHVGVGCVSVWCGSPPPDGTPVLAFLRVDDNRDYFLEVGACPTTLMMQPTDQDLDQITSCMRGEACEAGW
ncbi:hypothetical protein [Nioella aestuarii]|uniref:hypothetical protein n=1 Tax=Nioella aestuarii TaxID=1662864 RepID=UPI003D7FABA7